MQIRPSRKKGARAPSPDPRDPDAEIRFEERVDSMEIETTVERPTSHHPEPAMAQSTDSSPYPSSDNLSRFTRATCGKKKGAIVASGITAVISLILIVLEVLRRQNV